MSFTGTCPVCGTDYIPLDREASRAGRFVVTVDDDTLAADAGDVIMQVCETCHSAGRVRREDVQKD